ncbi:MAG TPA: hypothetical protein VEU74_11915 [Gemmatimonadales bacterium]|nr:hypothetical protein [Gemmatimonadales bacterium]
MTSSPHPDYLAVSEERRWGKPLDTLFPTLRAEAWKLKGGWTWRVLPHGALVSVRVAPPEAGKEAAFHLELRIARKEAPKDVEGWRKWSAELAVFLKHMSGDEGDWESTVRSEEKAEAVFRFRLRSEVAKPKCARCGNPDVIEPGLFKEDLCRQCATELAAADVARNRNG